MNLYRVSIKNPWNVGVMLVVADGWDDAAKRARKHDGPPPEAWDWVITSIERIGPASDHDFSAWRAPEPAETSA